MIEKNDRENSTIDNSYLSFNNDKWLGFNKNYPGNEADKNKENLQDANQKENLKADERKSELKKQHEGSKSFSFGPTKDQDLSKNTFDSLGSSFLIKEEENEKVTNEEDDEEEEVKEVTKYMENDDLNEWLHFFHTFEDRAMKDNLKKVYMDLRKKKTVCTNRKKKYPQSYYNVNYLITFVQCQSYLFKEALPKLEKMKSFYDKNEKTTDLGPTDMAFFYSELASCYSNLDNFKKADICFDKASQLIEKEVILKAHVKAYHFSALGQHLLRKANHDSALQSFAKCLDILKKMPEEGVLRPVKTILLAWCYIDFSDAYISRGTEDSYREAEKFLELAVNRLKLINSKELHFMGKVERNYGQISYKKERDELKALKHYDKALEILQETLPGESCLIKKYNDERRQICDDVYY